MPAPGTCQRGDLESTLGLPVAAHKGGMRLIDRQQEAMPAAQLRQAQQVSEIACKAATRCLGMLRTSLKPLPLANTYPDTPC